MSPAIKTVIIYPVPFQISTAITVPKAYWELVSQGKLNESSIICTIGQLAAGKVQLERKPGERLVCSPIGTGAMDIGCASVVYQRALEQGRGQFFDFGVSSAIQATQN